MAASPILVTGATGNVGRPLVELLRDQGLQVRAAVRDVARAQRRWGAGVDYVRFDFRDPATFAAAFSGVRAVFLVRPPDLSNAKRDIAPAIAAAAAAGVAQIAFLSLLGAERNPVVPHAAIEKLLREASVPWTFLRPSFFMQNLTTTHRDDIRDGDAIFVPAGQGRTSFIDVRDIAAVAARVLTEQGHERQAYPLTGAAALTYGEVAVSLTEALGRPICYANPSALAFATRMLARGFPPAFVLVMIGIYTTARLGLAASVTPDCERLLRRPPISVAQFAHDERAAWLR